MPRTPALATRPSQVRRHHAVRTEHLHEIMHLCLDLVHSILKASPPPYQVYAASMHACSAGHGQLWTHSAAGSTCIASKTRQAAAATATASASCSASEFLAARAQAMPQRLPWPPIGKVSDKHSPVTYKLCIEDRAISVCERTDNSLFCPMRSCCHAPLRPAALVHHAGQCLTLWPPCAPLSRLLCL